ncbi:MAG: M48 family metalloprotease [Hyphomicrobium sp.]|jgi:Zn-dependent protease with chaperone function
MAQLYFASLLTLTLLAGMLAGLVIAVLVAMESMDLGIALALTVALNLLLFVVSPWITDLTLRWVNGVQFLDDDALAQKHPHVHAIIHDVAREYGFKAPSIGIIADRNPTAFTYGILRSNARIVLTDGIFEFLGDEETKAVVAHELGHIVHRDFLVMTIAGMLVQMTFQIYARLRRVKSDSKKGNQLIVVAMAAYVAYLIGTYVLLYLSRTREYLADSFSAERVEARHLANALIKIAYGIAQAADTETSRNLLAGTRHLGVVDVRSASRMGLVAESGDGSSEAAAKAMLFDCYNPWAKLVEISSTHPLTGRRILALAAIARNKGQSFPDFDIEATARRAGVDLQAVNRQFREEALVVAMPWLAAFGAVVLGMAPLAPAALAVGWLWQVRWRYPLGAPAPATVTQLLGDWSASPVRGRLVKLSGKPIGRVDAGSAFGEDLIFADKTGRIATDFRSMLGPLGDMYAGWARVDEHLEQEGEALGWYRRGLGGFVILRRLSTRAGVLEARPYFWEIAFPLVILAGTAVFGLMVLGGAPH